MDRWMDRYIEKEKKRKREREREIAGELKYQYDKP